MRYDLRGVPDDLVPGKYATRVSEESHWENGDLVIVLDFAGSYDEDNPCLISFDKTDPPVDDSFAAHCEGYC